MTAREDMISAVAKSILEQMNRTFKAFFPIFSRFWIRTPSFFLHFYLSNKFIDQDITLNFFHKMLRVGFGGFLTNI
jgi:hypothetical protein